MLKPSLSKSLQIQVNKTSIDIAVSFNYISIYSI